MLRKHNFQFSLSILVSLIVPAFVCYTLGASVGIIHLFLVTPFLYVMTTLSIMKVLMFDRYLKPEFIHGIFQAFFWFFVSWQTLMISKIMFFAVIACIVYDIVMYGFREIDYEYHPIDSKQGFLSGLIPMLIMCLYVPAFIFKFSGLYWPLVTVSIVANILIPVWVLLNVNNERNSASSSWINFAANDLQFSYTILQLEFLSFSLLLQGVFAIVDLAFGVTIGIPITSSYLWVLNAGILSQVYGWLESPRVENTMIYFINNPSAVVPAIAFLNKKIVDSIWNKPTSPIVEAGVLRHRS